MRCRRFVSSGSIFASGLSPRNRYIGVRLVKPPLITSAFKPLAARSCAARQDSSISRPPLKPSLRFSLARIGKSSPTASRTAARISSGRRMRLSSEPP
ncbi:hypothetical protein D9M69_681280 [compost metagenome]